MFSVDIALVGPDFLDVLVDFGHDVLADREASESSKAYAYISQHYHNSQHNS